MKPVYKINRIEISYTQLPRECVLEWDAYWENYATKYGDGFEAAYGSMKLADVNFESIAVFPNGEIRAWYNSSNSTHSYIHSYGFTASGKSIIEKFKETNE